MMDRKQFRWLLLWVAPVLLTGCATDLMTQSRAEYEPQGHKSLVTFIRTDSDVSKVYRLWDGKHLIGKIGSRSVVQYQTDPGSHLFLCETTNWSVVKGELASGRHYVLTFGSKPLSKGTHVTLTPVKRGQVKRTTIFGWLSRYRCYRLNSSHDGVASRRQGSKVERAVQDVSAGRLPFLTLSPDDFF